MSGFPSIKTLQQLLYAVTLVLSLQVFPIHASEGNGTTAGLQLLLPSSARSSALGQAITALPNEISAFSLNPATLNTLEEPQSTFLFNKGYFDDKQGDLGIGFPLSGLSLGGSLRYSDAGDVENFDNGERTIVKARTDLIASFGIAFPMGSSSWGLAAKYISAELAERESAQAVAIDAGYQTSLARRMNVGIAIQNFGTDMKFLSESAPLPRLIRAGTSWTVGSKVPFTFLLDVPYYFKTQELAAGGGLEVNIGPLALRGGYKSGTDLGGFSMGTGFALNSFNLDYAAELLEDVDLTHRVSLTMKWGNLQGEEKRKPTLSRDYQRKQDQDVSVASLSGKSYMVQSGDSLVKISSRIYGTPDKWRDIVRINKDSVDLEKGLHVGQILKLP